MSVIRGLIADAGVQPVVIVVVKINGPLDLRTGEVRKKGPLAALKFLGFEVGPQALGLVVVVAIARLAFANAPPRAGARARYALPLY